MPAESEGRTGSPDPVAELPGIPHREFLERALTAAGEWTRFSDPKALGVLVLLGLGVADLIGHAGRLVRPHEATTKTCDLVSANGHSCEGIGATVAFVIACLFAAAAVAFVTHALFSRMTFKGLLGAEHDETAPRSRFFFAEVSRYGSQEAYAQAVLAKKPHELLRDVAGQVYEVSRVCRSKHLATQRAYVCTLAFLIAWVTARILLSTVT